MQKHITPIGMTNFVYFSDIDKCPICNSKISPIYLAGKIHSEQSKFSLYCECPSCENPFVVLFSHLVNTSGNIGPRYFASDIEFSAPIYPQAKTFDDKISLLSKEFVETYNQSLAAEAYSLTQIAGMGYRKSLEFLIKDYCVYKYPSDSSKIYSMLLGQCINDYIEDSKIKNLAKVSAWLGNDETHYVKKFADKDIGDLKRFIDTVVYFILYNLNADEADNIVNSHQ